MESSGTDSKLTQQEMDFFAAYCRDSYAGFTPLDKPGMGIMFRNAPWESGGYLHYRPRFAGAEMRLAMEQITGANDAQA